MTTVDRSVGTCGTLADHLRSQNSNEFRTRKRTGQFSAELAAFSG